MKRYTFTDKFFGTVREIEAETADRARLSMDRCWEVAGYIIELDGKILTQEDVVAGL